ncbi:filaggrin-2-like [Leptidea sinapis]|uniref:filaggrin-2-like n=1 Tax=Leptidea sinapis TaxID=189913 RepID=UPI0021C496C3|nr:filaggrin-2-like [Leptidea sinapis]
MKLFVIAALVSVAVAGRLEHLERSYLPPDSSNSISQGFPSNGGSHGFGSSGNFGTSGRGSQNFGQNGHSSNGFGQQGSNGFGGQGLSATALKQYLPPDFASNTGSSFGNSNGLTIKPACSTCGRSHQLSSNQFGSQGPSSQYGLPNFGAASSSGFGSNGFASSSHGSNGFGSAPNGFASSNGAFGSHGSAYNSGSNGFGSSGFPSSQGSFGSQGQSQFGASRQYLAPKSSNIQELPQQPFDEQTGYHY